MKMNSLNTSLLKQNINQSNNNLFCVCCVTREHNNVLKFNKRNYIVEIERFSYDFDRERPISSLN